MILHMPDEDVFARLPRVFRAACHGLRDGLRSGFCDPYPLALGTPRQTRSAAVVCRANREVCLGAVVAPGETNPYQEILRRFP
jgi:hypothetical protein